MDPLSHFVTFALPLLFMIPISDAYDLPSHDITYDEKTDFYIVMVVAMTINIINLLGSLYIFHRTFLRWKYFGKNISLSLRFPFYIAITDFLYSSTSLINLSYSASNGPQLDENVITWPTPYCEVLGFFDVSFLLLNMLLVGVISFTTWLRVVREYYFDFGRFDHKIWSPIIFISLLIPLISIQDFGSQKYWCEDRYFGSLITILDSIVIILTLTVIIFCYIHVLKTIYHIKESNSPQTNSQVGPIQRTNIERKSLNKVLTYILVFILQYIPILIFNIYRFLEIQHVIIYALIPSAVSIGGIGNLIQYINNEGLILRPSNNITLNNLEADKQSSNGSTNTE